MIDIFIPITINKYFSSCNTPSMDKQFLDKRDRHAGISLILYPELLFPYDSNGLCIYNLSGSNKVTAHLYTLRLFRRHLQAHDVTSNPLQLTHRYIHFPCKFLQKRLFSNQLRRKMTLPDNRYLFKSSLS